ncbi:hypothetical protein [Pedobacter hiemivivus]|uniref:Uncharacterized protein n=1 Tax=Pedobacter hiemivivus TaxID=2530454 RepID=A0A4R0MS80_9SPHI|nr:hypothetical protein [Pedobacter hiemivivus]TCC89613.1 hypothetical protein EZ444_21035 [Pedobacter hiemivivus]
MNYKKLLILSLMLCIGLAGKAQEFLSAKFTIEDYKKGVQEIELTYNTFIIGISPKGEIAFIEPLKRSRPNQWDDFEDNPVRGLKNLGNLKVTYYDNFDKIKAGKIKSIDGIAFDYYGTFDMHDSKGSLKSIGKMAINYNNVFDMREPKGTFKSIGDISIKYNNVFDRGEIQESLKSIGPVQITWYKEDEEKHGKIRSIRGNTQALYVTKAKYHNNNNLK